MKLWTAILTLFVLLVGCPDQDPQGDDDTTAIGDDDSQPDDDDTADAVDQDGDGWTVDDGDCDDTNPFVHPGAVETCNGVDSDCDGLIDEGCQECDLEVPGDHHLIQGAIDLAVDGVTICVAPGTYFETIDFGGKAVHLLGVEGATETIIDAELDGEVVRFSNAEGPDTVLEGFTLTNGYSMFGGAGVYVEDSSPTLINLEITSNHADGYGGGFHLNEGQPSLTNVTISGNSANRGGGAYLWGSGTPQLSNVTITGNQAENGGGVYFCLDCQELDFSSTEISENTALADGGGFYLGGGMSPSSTDILGATITANHAEGSGGGVYAEGAANGLFDVIVTSNTAGSYGGGMAIVDTGLCDVSGAYLSGNEAWNGGGLYVSSGSNSFSNMVIEANTATANGGGVYLESCEGILESLLVDSNQAGAFGGGVYITSGSPELLHLSVTNNTAFDGGGVYDPSSLGTLDGFLVSGNHATNDGGGGWGAPHFVNSVIVGNTAEHHGGGIFQPQFQLVLDNVAVLGNRSDEGGGIYLYGGSEIWSHVVVAGNEAASEGGGVYWGDWIGFVYDLTAVAIIGNTTTAGQCGGLFVSDTPPDLTYSNVFANTPSDYCGLADPTGTNGNISVDPEFLDISAPDPLDWDLHLSLTSPLIDAGDPAILDPDGSPSDIGAYGGLGAATWDLDWDGYFEWWQPGEYDSVTSSGMDCDDQDETVYPGSGC